jgi:hypothetical protein
MAFLLTEWKACVKGIVSSRHPVLLPRGCSRKLDQILTLAGLAAAIFFTSDLQAEPLGPQSAPLWLRYPAISPDGRRIAFGFEGHLFIIPSAGGIAQSLTAGPAHDTAPVWSPDGKLIAFASDRYGHYNVFLVNVEGGPARRLTSYSTDEVPTGFTPDGKYVQRQPRGPIFDSIQINCDRFQLRRLILVFLYGLRALCFLTLVFVLFLFCFVFVRFQNLVFGRR